MANSREKKTRNVFTEKAALEQEIAALQANTVRVLLSLLVGMASLAARHAT